MDKTDLTLELSSEQIREMVEQSLSYIIKHLESLPELPSITTGGAELAHSLKEPLPEHGQPFAELLELLFGRVIPHSYNTAGPGYLAYIPGGGLPHAAIADLIANATNRYVGVWIAAPGLAQLETNVVRWLCDIMGYPSQSLGVLTSGGSLANFTAVVTARRDRLPENFLSGTLYASDQTHHSIRKAAMIAGFPAQNVREVPADERFPIRVDALKEKISQDRKAGLTPFMIVGNAGTTNTGAVDDLQALAEIAQRENMWLHIDGAYGGCFMLTGQGRQVMAGIERADSITLDPHKGLFLPYGTGALLVKDRETLRRAHSTTADYMPEIQEDPDFVDFCELSPELSRDFRGLRLWLPIKMHGIGPFRRNLEEKLALTRWATEQLRHLEGIEIVAEPQLSIVAFRLKKPGLDAQALNQLNRDLIRQINARNHVFLTGTMLGDRFVIRICVLSFRTHLDRMEQCLQDIKAAIAQTAC